jgi:peptide chain release factor 3
LKQTVLPRSSKKKRSKNFQVRTPFRREKRDCRYFLSGDIVGLHDTGNFKIGDTLTEGEVMSFKGIPSSLRAFRYINNADPMKKQNS